MVVTTLRSYNLPSYPQATMLQQQSTSTDDDDEDEEIIVDDDIINKSPDQPLDEDLPLDLSSSSGKGSKGTADLAATHCLASPFIWQRGLLDPAVPLLLSLYPAWNALPYIYGPLAAATVLGPLAAANQMLTSPKLCTRPSSTSTEGSSPTMVKEKGASRSARRRVRNPSVRRMVANARERCRVHMISEAFEALRVALPFALPSQKLTKVSILRIACDYIMLLGALTGRDYSADQTAPSVDQLRQQLSDTILAETNLKC